MAEIRIEKKKKPVWPWILIILIIAVAVIWYFMRDNRNKILPEDDEIENQDTLGLNESYFYRDSSTAFIQYVKDSSMNAGDIKKGFFILADDLEEIMNREKINDLPMNAKLDSIKNNASKIKIDESSPEIKSAALSSVDLMINIQNKKYPELNDDSMKLRYAYDRVRKDDQLNKQIGDIKIFFKRAAILLDKMNYKTLASK